MTEYTIRLRHHSEAEGDHLSLLSADMISVSVALMGRFRIVDERTIGPEPPQQLDPHAQTRRRNRTT